MKPDCPVNENQCQWLDELVELRSNNQELSELVRVDPLTRLFNFRHFVSTMEAELERTRRTGNPTGLLVIDIDHFKRFNDTHGHDAGNAVLVGVAKVLTQAVRAIDVVCRYGGEEFVIVLPTTTLADSVMVAERVRANIERHRISYVGAELSVTVSVGVEVGRAGMAMLADELFKRADQWLYMAKKSGRNRVCHPEIAPATQYGVTADERRALEE